MKNDLNVTLVSVVITCYNQARYLADAIESVQAQTYPNIEIILVDDGSPDHTPEVVQRYPSVSYIRQVNQGVARARNRGLSESKGSYVVFLDGDDRLPATAVATQLNVFDSNPNCAMVVGQSRFISADGAPSDYVTPAVCEQDYYLALLHDNFIPMPAMAMYRRSVFESAGGAFSTRADHSSDYELYLRIARQHAILCHTAVVAEYRVHGANTSYHGIVMLKGTMAAYRRQWRYVRGHPTYEAAYKQGSRKWQERYGSDAVVEIRRHLKRGTWPDRKRAWYGIMVLVYYSPHAFKIHVKQKLKNMAARLFQRQVPAQRD